MQKLLHANGRSKLQVIMLYLGAAAYLMHNISRNTWKGTHWHECICSRGRSQEGGGLLP